MSLVLLGAASALIPLWSARYNDALPQGWSLLVVLGALLIGGLVGSALKLENKLDGNIIEKVDYLIPNEIEAQLMFETDNLEDIVEHYKGKVIITLGDKGVMYFDEGIVKIEPAQKIEVVDTTVLEIPL